MEPEAKKHAAYMVGIGVMILLAGLTIGEYFMGAFASAWALPILLVAAVKAYFVVRDYMHIGRVFAGDDEE
ncbi:MAG TPA: cytochrome C oxidase subunit IV family protein [Anaerolineales bacterium]|nr:cytochrome C oxidase subunit IV family protein [Anaerolineales bacterium]